MRRLLISNFITRYSKTDGERVVTGKITHEDIELPITDRHSIRNHIAETMNIHNGMAELFYGTPTRITEPVLLPDLVSWTRAYVCNGLTYEEVNVFKVEVR